MKNIIINDKMIPMNLQPIEVVERKGIGHPDVIAEGIAEAISNDYSLFCIKNFGAVLHHHFDKISIMGGGTKINFGIGEMKKPVRLILNGRVSSKFGEIKIKYKKIQEDATRDYLKHVLPALNINKWLKINSYTTSYSRSPVWYQPRNLNDLPELKTPYANDTAAITSYWPLSITERLVLKLERFFYNKNNSPKFDYIGQDIKVLAIRNKQNIDLTLCIPFFSVKILSKESYFEKLNEIKSQLLKLVQAYVNNKFKINISLNTQDRMLFEGPKRGTSHYFVVSGSALDYGEEGIVGRGNKTRGLISSNRPFSTDAIYGKNPTFHVGKVYTYFAEQITRKISEEFNCECTIFFIIQNKDLIASPHRVVINTTQKVNENEIKRIITEELNKKDWIKKIVKDKYFLPLPGGSYGFQEA